MKNNTKKPSTLSRVVKLIGRYRLLMLLSAVLAAGIVFLTLYVPILIGDSIDLIIGKGLVDLPAILEKLTLAAILIGITALMQWVMSSINNRITYHIVRDMRNDAFHISEAPYNIEVVDRIGSGDAYIAGVLYGLLRYHFDPKVAQEYGDAFSAMKCTIPGDFLIATESEITSIIEKHKKGINEDVNR